MPLESDPKRGGTNLDKSKSDQYCSFCYQNGKFLDEGITLEDKIEKNVQIAVAKMNMPENKARLMAEGILPTLERWKHKHIAM